MRPKLIRVTTIPFSMSKLLKGQLKFMNNHFDVIGVCSNGPFRIEVEKSESICTVGINMTRSITPIKDLYALWLLYKLFKEERPLIVHTHTPKAGTLGMIAAKLAGVEHRLHTVAGLPLLETKGLKRKLLNLVEKLTYACSTKVYPNSFGLKSIILENKFTKADKLSVLGKGSSNGIDTNYFKPDIFSQEDRRRIRIKTGFDNHHFVFIYVGRVVTDKGINELISAFGKIDHKDARLLIVGPFESLLDPLSPSTLSAIETHPYIKSIGYKEDVRPYLMAADALVFPSYREGLPNVVLQAGAMGLPSIVTNINGCNEIILDGLNGLIVPPKNPDALHSAMCKLINDPLLITALKSQARTLIVNRYGQEYVWKSILDEYKKIIGNV